MDGLLWRTRSWRTGCGHRRRARDGWPARLPLSPVPHAVLGARPLWRLLARAPMSWPSTLPGRLAPRLKLSPRLQPSLRKPGDWSKPPVRVGAKRALINAILPGCALRPPPARAQAAFGRLDILFANAGIQGFKPILEFDDGDWHDTIDVNLTGTCNAIRAVAPHLIRNGGGRIIVTSSTQGRHGTKY